MAKTAVQDTYSYIGSDGKQREAIGVVPMGPGSGSAADTPTFTKPAGFTPLGYQQIADAALAAATGFTVPGGAKYAIVQNNGSQPCRWRDDGTNPTASTGQRIPAGEQLTYDGNLAAIKFIREASGVTLDIHYYS